MGYKLYELYRFNYWIYLRENSSRRPSEVQFPIKFFFLFIFLYSFMLNYSCTIWREDWITSYYSIWFLFFSFYLILILSNSLLLQLLFNHLQSN